MKLVVFLILLFSICEAEKECDIDAYYWRDYYGTVPKDALPAGINMNRKPMFVGQIAVADILIPAKINVETLTTYYSYKNREIGTEWQVKILCTQHPNFFEWVATNNTMINQIKDRHLVNGGYYKNGRIYIGRTRHGDELIVGLLWIVANQYEIGLHVTFNSKSFRYLSYEILTYNPRIT